MINKETNDPRYAFYTNKFPIQDQETPALQDKMVPEPDAGEESYVGGNKLEGKRALVTGGDSGIGRAVAIAFAREGADVAIQYLPGEDQDAEEVEAYIKEAGRRSLLLPVDLREKETGAQIVEKTVAEFGGIDLLVLNAGQQIAQTSLEDLTMKQVRETFEVNIFSMYESIKAAEKHLQPGASIIMTSSVQGFSPTDHFLDYAATNASISNLTVNLAAYFGEKGIRVNAVAPGPIWTPLQLDQGRPKDTIPEFGRDTPLGRAGQPVELAPVYVLLASDDASYITGSIYEVTGGEAISL